MIQFGVCLPQDGKTYEDLRQLALKSEELGFDSVWLFDHLHSFPRPEIEPFIECWTTLSALAEATERVRLGSLVLNVQYRNPALLAKMSATLDNVSRGRLDLGIGAGGTGRAGWSETLGYTPEYKAYGMDFPEKPRNRVGRLEEALQVIRRLWTESKVTFKGSYYRIENAFCNPKPVQEPHPPIWIGGTGEKLLLKVVARFADGCNFAWDLLPEEYEKRLSVLDRYCGMFGRSPNSIKKSILTACAASRNMDQVKRTLEDISRDYGHIKGYVPYALREGALTGTIDDCIHKIEQFKEVGITHFMLVFPNRETDRWLQEFAGAVMSSF